MSPTSYSRAFSSPTRQLTLLKNISKVPKRQVVKIADSSTYLVVLLSARLMGEAITKIPTRTGMIDPRVVPFEHTVFKELELVQQ